MGLLGDALGARGKPPDLRAYAAERGLEWMDTTPPKGIYYAHPFDEPSNLAYGALPGGEVGTLCHIKAATRPGHQETGYAPNTYVATRVPEAVAALQRMRVARVSELRLRYLHYEPDRFNVAADMGALGFTGGEGWSMTLAPGADQALARDLLSGEFGNRLAAVSGDFALEFDYGSLVLIHGESYAEGAELDGLCECLGGLAQALRETALAAAEPQSFDAALPRPSWEDTPAPGPQKKKFLGISFEVERDADLGSDSVGGLGETLREPFRANAFGVAAAVGGELEDPLAYHRAFPSIPVPGQAYAVVRTAAENGTERVALHTEGRGGGAVGVIRPVKNGVEDRPMPITWDLNAVSVAVRGGLMATWVHREREVSADDIALVRAQASELRTG